MILLGWLLHYEGRETPRFPATLRFGSSAVRPRKKRERDDCDAEKIWGRAANEGSAGIFFLL